MDLRPIHPILLIDLIVDTEEDRAHLEPCLQALEQDPASNVAIQRSGDCIALAAEDELQLETVLQQIVRAVPVLFGELRIGYRETIRLAAEAEGKYIRQTGGPGNYGHCYVRIDPNGRGRGYRFVNEIESGTIPDEYIKPIDDGIRAAMAFGILAGYPMTDVSATLFGGSYHETDSNEMAFKFAGSIAFKEAARKASPVLLEPVMAIAIEIPEQLAAAVKEDIRARRGRIERIDTVGGWSEIVALIPLAEVLRSSPRGRPEYSMHFAGYEIAPRRDDSGDGDIAVPALRPRHPAPRRTSVRTDRDE